MLQETLLYSLLLSVLSFNRDSCTDSSVVIVILNDDDDLDDDDVLTKQQLAVSKVNVRGWHMWLRRGYMKKWDYVLSCG